MSAIREPVRRPPREKAARERLLQAVAEQLDAVSVPVDRQADLDALAKRMVAVIPRRSPWNDLLGPFYTTRAVADLLGVSRQAIRKRVQSGSVVRVVAQDGESLFPAFQFHDGAPLPGLLPVVRALRRGTDDEYAIAQWLVVPDGRTGLTPADRLAAGEHADVLRAAVAAAAAWAG